MMYRLGKCQYTRPNAGRGISDKNNRSWQLLKRKDFHDAEFLITDVEEGLGKRHNMVGAFYCKTPEGSTFRVGSGLTDEEATKYFIDPPIGHFVKIKFLCYTSDKIPFNPIVLTVS